MLFALGLGRPKLKFEENQPRGATISAFLSLLFRLKKTQLSCAFCSLLLVANVTSNSTNHDQIPSYCSSNGWSRHCAVDITSNVAEKYRAPEAALNLVEVHIGLPVRNQKHIIRGLISWNLDFITHLFTAAHRRCTLYHRCDGEDQRYSVRSMT
jgi:hypothetical protein